METGLDAGSAAASAAGCSSQTGKQALEGPRLALASTSAGAAAGPPPPPPPLLEESAPGAATEPSGAAPDSAALWAMTIALYASCQKPISRRNCRMNSQWKKAITPRLNAALRVISDSPHI